MRSISRATAFITRYAADERGATAIEYGLIAALIAVVIIGGLNSLEAKLNNMMSNVASKIK